jgi:hypothetical protein
MTSARAAASTRTSGGGCRGAALRTKQIYYHVVVLIKTTRRMKPRPCASLGDTLDLFYYLVVDKTIK